MTTSHDARCRCADCRSRRAIHAVGQSFHPPDPVPVAPVRTIEELVKRELEQQGREWEDFVVAVHSDPLAYVLASRQEGTGFKDIAAVLAHCGFDDESAAALIEEARSILNATRVRRGLGRMLLGAAEAGAGVGLSIGLSSMFSGWTVLFWGLVLVGLFHMGQGVYIMAKSEGAE